MLTCCGIRDGASCGGTRSVREVAQRATTVGRTSGSSCGGAADSAYKRRWNTAIRRLLWGPFFCLWRILGFLLALWWRF